MCQEKAREGLTVGNLGKIKEEKEALRKSLSELDVDKKEDPYGRRG